MSVNIELGKELGSRCLSFRQHTWQKQEKCHHLPDVGSVIHFGVLGRNSKAHRQVALTQKGTLRMTVLIQRCARPPAGGLAGTAVWLSNLTEWAPRDSTRRLHRKEAVEPSVAAQVVSNAAHGW